jgi:hypothetical protein
MKSRQRMLKMIALSVGFVLLGLILLGAGLRILLVEYDPIQCSLLLQYGWNVQLLDYAKAHPDKKYPPMSPVPGVLFLGIESVSPQFVSNWGDLFCIAADSAYEEQTTEQQFASPTLAYFGYALCNEDELLAFLEEYPKLIESGADFNADLPAPAGRGSFGGDQFLRLTSDLDQGHGGEVWGIPILFEIPDFRDGDIQPRHWNGCGVALMFGSDIKNVEYGTKFPMTPAIIEKIGEIKAKYATVTLPDRSPGQSQ